MSFEREELIELRERCIKMSDAVVNQGWKRAYDDLAYAANVLDAMTARSTVINSEEVKV